MKPDPDRCKCHCGCKRLGAEIRGLNGTTFASYCAKNAQRNMSHANLDEPQNRATASKFLLLALPVAFDVNALLVLQG